MKIVINNLKFDFNIGCRLLKSKHKECPTSMTDTLGDMWNDIQPITFKEIAKNIENMEERRVAIGCMGIDEIVKEVNPILEMSETIKKKTTWVNKDGVLETINFKDKYDLYRVKGDVLFADTKDTWRKPSDVCYVKFKDTSTDREYFIWVDAESVYRINAGKGRSWYSSSEDYISKITPIQAIAWTIQTDLTESSIQKIVRQGDCILIKKNKGWGIDKSRHLTEQEYREKLVLES